MLICYAVMSHSVWRMFWFAFSCCDKHDQKQLGVEKGLSSSHWLKFIKEARAGAQGRNLGTVTEGMIVEDCGLPAGFSWVAQFAFVVPQNHMPRDGAVYSGLGPHTPLTNQKKIPPWSRLQANFMEASSQLRSSFQTTLACVKLTKTS